MTMGGNGMGNMMMFSPSALVVWGAFEARAYNMQRDGWEFACERRWTERMNEVSVLIKHRDSYVCMEGVSDAEELMSRAHRGYSDNRPIIIRINRVLPNPDGVKFRAEVMPQYGRIDMRTEIAEWDTYDINDLGVFKPWGAGKQELLVDPASVSSLMDQIRKLQDPQLAEIRKRNRLRESRGGKAQDEQVVAQIIQLSA